MTGLDLAALSAAGSAKASRQCLRPSSCRTDGLVLLGGFGLVPSGHFGLSREQQRRPSTCLPPAPWEAQLQHRSALLAFTKLHVRYFCCTFPEPLRQGLWTSKLRLSVVLGWRVHSISLSFPPVLQQKGLERAVAEQAGIAFVFQGLEEQAQQRFRRAGGAPWPHAVLRSGVAQGSIAHLIPGSDGACDSPTHK